MLNRAALLLAVGIAPRIVTAVLTHGVPLPSVAQILYSVEPKDGRS